jgi:hypothetical protein
MRTPSVLPPPQIPPWYVVPAEDKKNTCLIISAALLHKLQRMKLAWPVLPAEQKAELEVIKEKLKAKA